MSGATLEIEEINGQRCISIRCLHVTIIGGSINGVPIGEPAMIALMLQRHHEKIGCRCTEDLRRKYPLDLLPPTLAVLELHL